ncbi:DUF6992 family protein [Haliscomenobacter sp.]|uniref:DUF6992 family protein n=1 Tax=Haliscomenobacter sp. TaxID=2717303 RepID=UPI003BAAE089
MKKVKLTFVFILLAYIGFSQSNFTDLSIDRLNKQRQGMLVLGTWALGNMAVGAIRLGHTSGENKAFQQMQIGWNVVNLGIATLGYFSTLKVDPSSWDTYQSVQEHYKIQKILLFNAGLDVGYMLGGAYLMQRGQQEVKNAERLRGFGRSILIQGAFLFAFDLSLHSILSSDNPKLKPLLTQSSIGFAPNEVHLRLNLSK